MMKIIKKVVLTIFVIMILFFDVGMCNAKTLSFKRRLVSSSGNNTNNKDEEDIREETYLEGGGTNKKTYKYEYTVDMNTKTNISMNAYDMEGNSLIPHSTRITNTKFKSGTWIGINVTEEHYADWAVKNFKYYKGKRTYTCKYEKKTSGHYSEVQEKSVGTGTISKSGCSGRQVEDAFDIVKGSIEKNGKKVCKNDNHPCIYTGCRFDDDKKNCLAQYQYWISGTTNTMSYSFDVEYGQEVVCPNEHPNNSQYDDLLSTKYEDGWVDVTNSTDPNIVNKKNDILAKAIKEIYEEAKGKVSWSNSMVLYIKSDKYPTTEEEPGRAEKGVSLKFEQDTYAKLSEAQKKVTTSGSLARYYEVLENKVCMNLKTSEVSYGNECVPGDEVIQIPNGTTTDEYWLDLEGNPREVNYWHYFIPLNTKSNQEFYIKVIKNEGNTFPVGHCKDFIENNEEDYEQFIVPVFKDRNGNQTIGTFEGDYDNFTEQINKENSNDWITLGEETTAGCYISATVDFPITQKFYGESINTDSTVKLKGFNFYYRPIDINDPFPNRVEENGLWYSWNESTAKIPDISKSFTDTPTYIASNINVHEIREYTKKNPYTSWANMNLNGTSSYIGTGNNFIIQRKNGGNIYQLGCGPANENKKLANGNNNPLYIERCDKS